MKKNIRKESRLISNEDRKKIIYSMVEEIDNTWLLNQIIKLLVNLKK